MPAFFSGAVSTGKIFAPPGSRPGYGPAALYARPPRPALRASPGHPRRMPHDATSLNNRIILRHLAPGQSERFSSGRGSAGSGKGPAAMAAGPSFRPFFPACGRPRAAQGAGNGRFPGLRGGEKRRLSGAQQWPRGRAAPCAAAASVSFSPPRNGREKTRGRGRELEFSGFCEKLDNNFGRAACPSCAQTPQEEKIPVSLRRGGAQDKGYKKASGKR